MIKSILIIATMSIVTMFTRLFPSLVFKKNVPPVLSYLGNVLPASIVAMLTVYCLKDIDITTSPFGAPEFISIICVMIIQIWKRNSLMSILFGTIIYMVLIRVIA